MKLIQQQAIGILFAVLLVSCAAKKPFTPTGSSASSQGTSSTYGGANKEYDTRLLTMREEIAPRFQTLTFADTETGVSMEYNLFVPANYDPSKKYPLILFMADASTVGKGVVAPLKQGYGGIIWATDESQWEHPSLFLFPHIKDHSLRLMMLGKCRPRLRRRIISFRASSVPIASTRIVSIQRGNQWEG